MFGHVHAKTLWSAREEKEMRNLDVAALVGVCALLCRTPLRGKAFLSVYETSAGSVRQRSGHSSPPVRDWREELTPRACHARQCLTICCKPDGVDIMEDPGTNADGQGQRNPGQCLSCRVCFVVDEEDVCRNLLGVSGCVGEQSVLACERWQRGRSIA